MLSVGPIPEEEKLFLLLGWLGLSRQLSGFFYIAREKLLSGKFLGFCASGVLAKLLPEGMCQ